MYNLYPQILGIIDKLNEWNDELSKFASEHMDNVGFGTLMLGALIIVAFWGINTLNKNN